MTNSRELEELNGLVARVQHHAAEYVVHRVRLILERGHHAKVAASAAKRPVEVLVLGGARRHHFPLGSDYVEGEDVIACESVLAH